MELMSIFSTFAGFAAGNVAIAAFLNNLFKVEKKWLKRLISWVLPIVMAAAAFALQLGMFKDFGPINGWFGWVYALLTGLGAALASNGLYDIEAVRGLVDMVANWIKTLDKKEEKVEE